jgi:hypothetical protein
VELVMAMRFNTVLIGAMALFQLGDRLPKHIHGLHRETIVLKLRQKMIMKLSPNGLPVNIFILPSNRIRLQQQPIQMAVFYPRALLR